MSIRNPTTEMVKFKKEVFSDYFKVYTLCSPTHESNLC